MPSPVLRWMRECGFSVGLPANHRVMARSCAASMVKLFAVPEHRGIAWTVEDMPAIIQGVVEGMDIPKKHMQEAVQDALTFYHQFLEDVLRSLVELQKATTSSS